MAMGTASQPMVGSRQSEGGQVSMFVYEKTLQYPIKVKKTDPRLAKVIITQYGGP